MLRMALSIRIGEKQKATLREVALRFRYWMDEDGVDGMCFTTENHSLLFHACQLMAGKLYPDEMFSRSGRTVEESRAWLKRIAITWAILNGLGFIMAYVTPFFQGGTWNP